MALYVVCLWYKKGPGSSFREVPTQISEDKVALSQRLLWSYYSGRTNVKQAGNQNWVWGGGGIKKGFSDTALILLSS